MPTLTSPSPNHHWLSQHPNTLSSIESFTPFNNFHVIPFLDKDIQPSSNYLFVLHENWNMFNTNESQITIGTSYLFYIILVFTQPSAIDVLVFTPGSSSTLITLAIGFPTHIKTTMSNGFPQNQLSFSISSPFQLNQENSTKSQNPT